MNECGARGAVAHLTEAPAVRRPPQLQEEEEEDHQLHTERLHVHMSLRVRVKLLPVASSYVSDVTSCACTHARTHALGNSLWTFIYLFFILLIIVDISHKRRKETTIKGT